MWIKGSYKIMFKPLSKKDEKILNKIFANLEPGTSKRIDNSKVFTPLSVERLSENRYSMAHYHECMGDLCPDPDIELLKAESGWFPIALQQMNM